MEEQFNKFLLKHRIKRKFARNLKNRETYTTINEYLKLEKRSQSYMLSAFPWSNTPEGLDFWAELNNKWTKEIEKNKIFKS